MGSVEVEGFINVDDVLAWRYLRRGTLIEDSIESSLISHLWNSLVRLTEVVMAAAAAAVRRAFRRLIGDLSEVLTRRDCC